MHQRISYLLMIVFFLFARVGHAQETLTWEDCLKEAAENHPDLIIAYEEITQSKGDKTIASSSLFPQISADAAISTSHFKHSGSSKSSSYGVSGEQLIFDGLKTVNDTRAASENIKAAKESYRFASSQVRWRLRTAFIGLLRAQSLVKITEDIRQIRKQNWELIKLRYESGMEHRGAFLTADANLAQAEFDIKSAKRAVEVAQQELIKELGRSEFSSIEVNGNFAVEADIEEKPDFVKIADKHPNLLKAVAQENAALWNVKSSKGDFLPTVSVNGDLGKSGSSWPPDEFGSGAGLRVSLPIFSGGVRVARLSQAKSLYRQLQANERGTKDGLLVALRASWNDFEDAVDNIDVEKKFMAATEERSKISESQYSVGLISFDNWTIIQDDLVRQKKSLLDAQANALLAQANWIEAQGETLEYEE